jgi:hypothetical protein
MSALGKECSRVPRCDEGAAPRASAAIYHTRYTRAVVQINALLRIRDVRRGLRGAPESPGEGVLRVLDTRGRGTTGICCDISYTRSVVQINALLRIRDVRRGMRATRS